MRSGSISLLIVVLVIVAVTVPQLNVPVAYAQGPTPTMPAETLVELTLVTGSNGTVDNLIFELSGNFPTPYAVMLDQPGDLQPGRTDTYRFTVPMGFCDIYAFKLTLSPTGPAGTGDDWLGNEMYLSLNGVTVWFDTVFYEGSAITETGWRGGTWDRTAEYRSRCPMTSVELILTTGSDGTLDTPYFLLEGPFSASPYWYALDQPGDLQPNQTDAYLFQVPMDFCQMTGWRIVKGAGSTGDDPWLVTQMELFIDGTQVFYDSAFADLGPITASSHQAGTWDGTAAYQQRCSSGVPFIPLATLNPSVLTVPGITLVTPPALEIPEGVPPIPPVQLPGGQMSMQPLSLPGVSVAPVQPMVPVATLPPPVVAPPVVAPPAVPLSPSLPPPAIAPLPSPTAQTSSSQTTVVICPGFMPSRLTVGQRGRVTPGLPNNLRSQPSTQSTLLGQIPGGGVFTVLDGPRCDPAGMAWWQVNYNGIIGWTPEGQGQTYWTEPVQ